MNFPGKILLLGEYGILLNSMALAVPFFRFSGRFRFHDASLKNSEEKESGSRYELTRLHRYLKSGSGQFEFLDLERFDADLKRGLYFESSIPSGSGLGSSGALTAAMYQRYANHNQTEDHIETRLNLAAIECFFHGLSSGIDPLTSFLKKPVLLDNLTQKFKTADLSLFLEKYTLFLINSHQRGNTGELVSQFMERYKDPRYKSEIESGYMPIINQTIKAIVTGDFESYESSMKKYTMFQLIWFEKMVPPELRKHMEHGTKTGDFNMKLCGSGGGGFMLAIALESQKAERYFKSNQIDFTVVKQTEINNKVLIK